MTMQDYENFFKTSDLALTAAICVSGFQVAGMQQTETERIYFLFDKSQRLDDIVSRFWSGQLSVEPQAYFNQLKILKTRIYRH
jgi:hypothetical protein